VKVQQTKVSDLPQDKFSVVCYCASCGTDQLVDLALYPELTFEDIHTHIKCPACGRYGMSFTIKLRKWGS